MRSPISPFPLDRELSGGCIIDRHLYPWHLRLPPPPPSVLPPLSLAQCVPGLMQLGRYLGQHQSFIQTPPPPIHTRTHKTVDILYRKRSQNVCTRGAEEQGVALGGRRIKITAPPPCLPPICQSPRGGDFNEGDTAMKPPIRSLRGTAGGIKR